MASSAEEDLRYFSSIGDVDGVRELISLNVDLNSRNSINGWTALHWAAARGYVGIVDILVRSGANPRVTNAKGETPEKLTNNKMIHSILGIGPDVRTTIPTLPILPSYLKYPALPVSNFNRKNYEMNSENQEHSNDYCNNKHITSEVILKVRLAGSEDADFIEIELSQRELTMMNLTDVCCDELEIAQEDIAKIRKLPNTVIRKDKDVQRLKDYEEIEIVLCDNQ